MRSKKPGKKYNVKLKEIYLDKGITSCEARLDKCMKTFAMSFHHRHKRVWYKQNPDWLTDFNHTILVCANCHGLLERDRELHYKVFSKLRCQEQKLDKQ